ncbi:tautomerase family protein [Serratia marcescens]|uniref:Tautomerase family protein n=1 Tax=Serratia marcescens TaxID=615 RepID=A0A5C7CKU5_SERMA|nr:tautomerase family protein [Serratia marcescens]TXE34702.1 tautomerase family protein [Serratia marcescens]TXE67242.1 tautomerase family protein [Serratia marcescens]
MPVFTITLKSRNTLDKKRISSAIHAAVVKTGYPANDQFQRFIRLEEDDLYVDPTYPDLDSPRSANFVLIEAMLSSGSPDARKQLLLQSLVQELALIGLDSNDLMVLFIELDRLNSSFGGGRRVSPLSMPQ